MELVLRMDCGADGLWIFGYGSLIWRPDFPYLESRKARLDGYVRRFWQGSTDHRGIPGAPGRVLTLAEAPGEHCWGRAFRLADDQREWVLAHLDHREKGGYGRLQVELQLEGGLAVEGLTYRAGPDNPEYLGPASIAQMVAQIAAAKGPSGSNRQYVLALEAELARQNIDDAELSELAAELRRYLAMA